MERDSTTPPAWRFRPMGEAAVLLEGQPALLANRYVVALTAALEERVIPGIEALVPGVSSLLVRFDPLTVDASEVEVALGKLLDHMEPPAPAQARVVTIPVRYGGACGPDLEAVAELTGLSVREVVAEHCRAVYHVLTVGFAPGFPYIGPLGTALTIPRRQTPRAAVAPGSVALAAGLTGIYPAQLPGGWHLIGRTPVRLFNPANTPPAFLMPGDRVRFEPLADGITP